MQVLFTVPASVEQAHPFPQTNNGKEQTYNTLFPWPHLHKCCHQTPQLQPLMGTLKPLGKSKALDELHTHQPNCIRHQTSIAQEVGHCLKCIHSLANPRQICAAQLGCRFISQWWRCFGQLVSTNACIAGCGLCVRRLWRKAQHRS